MSQEKDKILVYYISINGIDENKIPEYFTGIMNRLKGTTIPNVGEILTVPTYGENRVECINPTYITNDDLIKKHDRLMSELNESLKLQIKLINTDIEDRQNKGNE